MPKQKRKPWRITLTLHADSFVELGREIEHTLGMLHSATDPMALADKLGRAVSRPKAIEFRFVGNRLEEVIADMKHMLARITADAAVLMLADKLKLGVATGSDGRPRLIAPTASGSA